jgi:hypothetical protein
MTGLFGEIRTFTYKKISLSKRYAIATDRHNLLNRVTDYGSRTINY